MLWLGFGLITLLLPRRFYLVLPLSATVSLTLSVASVGTLTKTLTFELLFLHLRLDALSAVFLSLLGMTSFGISVYAVGYFRRNPEATSPYFALCYHLFLAAMAVVFLADDAYSFLFAWEIMAVSSYFLVTTDHRIDEIRKAGFLYLLMAHLSAFAILLAFAMLGEGAASFDFMRVHEHSTVSASVAFLLAVFGFGAKAGMLPLHVWLPEAHPAAPSPVSALMSGVMLKTAIYGLLRFSFDLLSLQLWWWGALLLILGLLGALFGVLFSAVETDMKRLLAYSSIENIGILFIGMGLCVLFLAFGQAAIAALALAATLFHALNHALFKSLLFLATGSVLHATSQRNLGKLGGLIHPMPKVAILALVGSLALAGLPPLNGFASEWLLLQTFLLTPSLPHSFLNLLIPVATGGLVLASALAAYVMVKFYGVVFLGQPREEKLKKAHDANWWEGIGMAWLALGCVLFGLFPVAVITRLDAVLTLLTGTGIARTAGQNLLFLTPLSPDRASYSAMVFLLAVLVGMALAFFGIRFFYHGRVRRAAPWNCGFDVFNPHMEDTAEGFGQPIRQIFEGVFAVERHMPDPWSDKPRYAVKITDPFFKLFYYPMARMTDAVARHMTMLQHGRIYGYLLYAFLTLLVLLVFAS